MHSNKRFATALLVLMLGALPGLTVAAQKSPKVAPDEFKDLPGVSARATSDEQAYECRTVLRRTDRLGEIDFLGDSGMPRLAYRCERNGIIYEGTRPPLSWKWAPGINPQELPE